MQKKSLSKLPIRCFPAGNNCINQCFGDLLIKWNNHIGIHLKNDCQFVVSQSIYLAKVTKKAFPFEFD